MDCGRSQAGNGERWTKMGQKWGGELPSCPELSPSRVAFKGHLLYARCCTRHFIFYRPMLQESSTYSRLPVNIWWWLLAQSSDKLLSSCHRWRNWGLREVKQHAWGAESAWLQGQYLPTASGGSWLSTEKSPQGKGGSVPAVGEHRGLMCIWRWGGMGVMGGNGRAKGYFYGTHNDKAT